MPAEELSNLRRLDRRAALNLAAYQLLMENHPPGLISVNITGGGEPLMHPDIIAIMAEVKKHQLKGSLITNGALLNSELTRQIVDMDWDGIRISIHAGDDETYRNVCGVDNFQKLKDNLIFFDQYRREKDKAERCQLILFNVIQRDNIPTIENIFQAAEEFNADHIEFERLIPFNEKFQLSAQELRETRDKLTSCARVSKISCNLTIALKQLHTEELSLEGTLPFRPAKRCSVGFDQAFITAQGDVYPCCFSDEKMGNISEQSLQNIWNNNHFNAFRQRLIRGKFAAYCYDNKCALPGVLHNW